MQQMIARHSSEEGENLCCNQTRLRVGVWCSTLDHHPISWPCLNLKNVKGLIQEPSGSLLMGEADKAVLDGG